MLPFHFGVWCYGIDLLGETRLSCRPLIEHFGDVMISGETVRGRHVAIGANILVFTDVPANSMPVGVLPRRKSPPGSVTLA